MQKIRWAVCGLGRISTRVLDAMRRAGDCEVVACGSTSRERAAEYAQKHSIRLSGTYEDVASFAEVDAVYICNNMSDHCRTALFFLGRKIPVLCEKSFTQNLEEAELVIAAAKANDTLVMEAMWTRFLPSTKKIIELAKSGKFGAVKSIEGKFTVTHSKKDRDRRMFKNAAGGGSLLDLGIYTTSYPHFLLGVPTGIAATGVVENGVDLSTDTTFSYAGGATAHVKTSIVAGMVREPMKVRFEKGTFTIPLFIEAKFYFTRKKYGLPILHLTPFRNGFQFEIRHFNDLVRNGKKESDTRTFQDTLDVMGIMTEIHRQLGVAFKTKLGL
jgi:predicted dehydrogenase